MTELTKELKEGFLGGSRLEMRPGGRAEGAASAKRNRAPSMRNSILKDPVVRKRSENRKGYGFSGESEGDMA